VQEKNWTIWAYYHKVWQMKLKEYLKENKLTHHDFIQLGQEQCGVPLSQGAVAKWCSETRVPRKTEMQVVFKVTNGEVTANDFYDLI
jgi:hypothetical protein